MGFINDFDVDYNEKLDRVSKVIEENKRLIEENKKLKTDYETLKLKYDEMVKKHANLRSTHGMLKIYSKERAENLKKLNHEIKKINNLLIQSIDEFPRDKMTLKQLCWLEKTKKQIRKNQGRKY